MTKNIHGQLLTGANEAAAEYETAVPDRRQGSPLSQLFVRRAGALAMTASWLQDATGSSNCFK